jgi:hypothetical protein
LGWPGFFHQLLVVSVIKIHPLGLQLFQGHGCCHRLITTECAASADSTAGFLPAPARAPPALNFLRRPRLAIVFIKPAIPSCFVPGGFWVTFPTWTFST